MKAILLNTAIGFTIVLSSFTCKKDKNQNFCDKERVISDTVYNRTGTVYYLEPYGRWGIRIDSATNSLDDSFVGFPCNLSNEFRVEASKVTFSGVLKHLNEDEIKRPEIKTLHLFYIELSSISH